MSTGFNREPDLVITKNPTSGKSGQKWGTHRPGSCFCYSFVPCYLPLKCFRLVRFILSKIPLLAKPTRSGAPFFFLRWAEGPWILREDLMPRMVRCALIQASNALSTDRPLDQIRKAMINKHLKLIEQAARKKAQILCLQELFYGPYFCAEQNARWYELTEGVPEGPTTKLMQKIAAKHRMAIVVPVYEEQMPGVYFNTAAVIDADGKYLGKYRKHHIPHCHPGFWEKFYFTPGDLGYPVFETKYAKVGVYICYDRHFPEGARILGLNGAEIVFNPSATVAGLSEYLWELEQPAHAVANGYFVGAINRVGTEKPWSIGEFYGKSYFCNPRGKIMAQASRDKDEVVVADLDLDMITEVRKVWQFFRDRRPETYGAITTQSVTSAAAD